MRVGVGVGRVVVSGKSDASAGGVRAVIRQILEVVPGGILPRRQDDLRGGFGLVDRAMMRMGAGKVDIGSPTRYLRFDGANLTWASDHTSLGADGTLTAVNGYFSGVLDAPVLDLELMKLCFSSISWAQFAVFEAFSDEGGRADPDPSSPDAEVLRGRLWNGGDVTPGRAFGFRSKEYADITTVYAGTSTAVGPGYLEDTAGTWFAEQYAGFELVVSSGTVRTLTGSGVSPRGWSLRDWRHRPRARMSFAANSQRRRSGSCRTRTAQTAAMARCSSK